MTVFAAIGLSFAGFATLAFSMTRHHHDLFGCAPSRRAVLSGRTAGWMLLAASFALSIRHSGPSVGIVLWFGIATAMALAVVLLLTYRHLWWRA